MNVEKFVAGLHEYLEKQFAPLLARLEIVESRQPEKGEKGESVTVEDVRPIVDRAVSEAVAKIPAAKDGIDGKSLTADDARPILEDLVSKLPRPRDGVDGKSVTVDELRPTISELVVRAIDSIPKPKDGIDGKGVTVDEVLPAVKAWFDALPKPKDGIDGKSVTVDDVLPLFNQAFDKWALDFERRAQDIHTRLLASFDKPQDGRHGIDGKDGADGLGFDDLRVEHDGERAFTFIFQRGEQRKEFAFTVPVVLERGVWKSDRSYDRGDAVTGDGSYWIAQKDAPQGKPGHSPDWRLAVKKGRDGKGS